VNARQNAPDIFYGSSRNASASIFFMKIFVDILADVVKMKPV